MQKTKSHQFLDDILDGSLTRDMLGNERADEFARRERAELHSPDNSDAAVAVHHELVKRVAELPEQRLQQLPLLLNCALPA